MRTRRAPSRLTSGDADVTLLGGRGASATPAPRRLSQGRDPQPARRRIVCGLPPAVLSAAGAGLRRSLRLRRVRARCRRDSGVDVLQWSMPSGTRTRSLVHTRSESQRPEPALHARGRASGRSSAATARHRRLCRVVSTKAAIHVQPAAVASPVSASASNGGLIAASGRVTLTQKRPPPSIVSTRSRGCSSGPPPPASPLFRAISCLSCGCSLRGAVRVVSTDPPTGLPVLIRERRTELEASRLDSA